MRRGSRELLLGARIEGAGEPVEYEVGLRANRHGLDVVREDLRLGPVPGHDKPLQVIRRGEGGTPQYFDQQAASLKPIPNLQQNRLALHSFGQFSPNNAVERTVSALLRISVHVPFDVRPGWTSPKESSALRRSNVLRPTRTLERSGSNLANAWHALKNDFGEEHWQETLLDVRMGLGPVVDTVAIQADPGGGQLALKLRLKDGSEESAFALSDGTLAYLAFVALHRLGAVEGGTSSLLAFDEPELYLHPELLVRVVGFFKDLARSQPVVLATHSDRVLDVLLEPGASVVLCELGPNRTTRLRRPDPDRLESWLEDYRGIGQLRAEGYEATLFNDRNGE